MTNLLDTKEGREALLFACKHDHRYHTESEDHCVACAAGLAANDPVKLAELLASEARRLGWAVYESDPGGSLLLPCLIINPDEDDSTIYIDDFPDWDACYAEPHGADNSMPHARMILASWLQLPDGAREQAERVLRGEM